MIPSQTDRQTDQLRDALRRATEHIEPVGLGVETVQRRGRGRRNRGRSVVAVATVTCVAGVGVAVTHHEGSKQHLNVAQTAAGSPAPTLEFRTVAGTLGYTDTHFTTPGGVTYALSTAPGAATEQAKQPDQAIYATSDGEHWTTADQHKSWIADLSEHDGVLYAIGTAPGATANAVTYSLATSHDGGQAWTDANLPFDESAPDSTVPLTHATTVQVARGASATVALLTESFWPNLDALVAQHAPGQQNVSTNQTADGFALLDMSECMNAKQGLAGVNADPSAVKGRAAGRCDNPPTLGTITWAELGLRGASDLRRQQMLVSTDGSHWNTVTAPSLVFVRDLVATDNGFLLLSESNTDPATNDGKKGATTTLLRSTDARSWAPVATPAGLNIQAIAGDRVLGIDAGGGVQTSTDGGDTWHATSIDAQLPAGASTKTDVGTTDAGPLGFAVVVTSDANPNDDTRGHDYLLFSTDGAIWSTSDLATSGQPAGAYPMQVTVGADHVSVGYQGTGAKGGGPLVLTTLLGTPKR